MEEYHKISASNCLFHFEVLHYIDIDPEKVFQSFS